MEPRIVTDPAVLAGKPYIRGTRISVEFILELFASGATADDVVKAYPFLTREDLAAAAQFAATSVAFLPHDAPTGSARRQAARNLDSSLARIEDSLRDIPVDEFEEIFVEAMRSVRPGYEEVR